MVSASRSSSFGTRVESIMCACWRCLSITRSIGSAFFA
jgi:hypothetical protein